jgi:hypothetical protein
MGTSYPCHVPEDVVRNGHETKHEADAFSYRNKRHKQKRENREVCSDGTSHSRATKDEEIMQ